MKSKNDEILKRNYNFFKSQLPTLLKDSDKKNKFALIKDEKIIGFYDDIGKAVDVAIKDKKFKWETFLVQKIETPQIHYISRSMI